MPIICKIQLDTADFKAQLDSIVRLTERVQADIAANAEATAQKVGADAEGAALNVKSAAADAAQTVSTLAENSAQAASSAAANAAETGAAAKTNAEEAAQAIREEAEGISQLTGQTRDDIVASAEEAGAAARSSAEEAAQAVRGEVEGISQLTEQMRDDIAADAEATAQGIGSAAESAARDVNSAAAGAAQTVSDFAGAAAGAGAAVQTSAAGASQAIQEELENLSQVSEDTQGDIAANAEEAGAAVQASAEKAANAVSAAADQAASDVEEAAERAAQAARDASSATGDMGGTLDPARAALQDAVKGMSKDLSDVPVEGFVDRLKHAFSSLGGSAAGSVETIRAALGKAVGLGSSIMIIAAGIVSIGKIIKTLAFDKPIEALKDIADRAAAESKSLQNAAAAAEKHRSATDAAAQSLAAFAEKDKLSNLEKEKAIRLIREMSQGYGDLGIRIDEATGKITGYTEALVRKMAKDREDRMAELKRQESNLLAQKNAQYDVIDANWTNDQSVTNEASARIQQINDQIEKVRAEFYDLKRSDPVGDYLADRFAKAGEKQRDVEKNEKQFAQNREFIGLSREEKGDALRARIAEEQGKIDSLGETLKYNEHIASQKSSTDTGKAKILEATENAIATREEILKSRQRLSDLQKQLDALDEEDRNRRDKETDEYAAGLQPVEKAELYRSRLAAARKDEADYRKELDKLEKPGAAQYEGAADEDRKLALKDKIVKAQERIQDLTKQVADAEAEAIRQEQEAQDKINGILDARAHALEIAKAEAAAEYEKADALRLEGELRQQNLSLSEDQLATAKKLAAEQNAVSLKSNLTDQTRDLLDAAKRSAGLDREADTDKAIREAEKTKRGKLDDDERAYVQKLVDLSWAVSGQEENPLAWKPDLSSRTNELTARGGFSSGAVIPSTEQINKSILSELQTKLKALGDIKELLQEGLQT